MHKFLSDNPAISALVASATLIALLTVSYFVFEPMVSYGATSSFTVTQQVTSELSFKTAPNNVTMTPSIPGLTGGTSHGTSTFNITTNNATGYNVTIQFSSTTAMKNKSSTSTSVIKNYNPAVGGTPDYNFTVAANSSAFGYTVNNVTKPSAITSMFKDNGSACNGGFTGTTVGKCWYNVGATGDARNTVTIINDASSTAATGATSTVVFQVGISANPSPAIQTGYYQATATLTAVTN